MLNGHTLPNPKGNICLIFRSMDRNKQRVSKKLNLIFGCFLNLQKSLNQTEFDLQIELQSRDRTLDLQFELVSSDEIFDLQIELLFQD